MMTKQETIEFIINAPDMDPDEMTEEQAVFYDRGWEELTQEEKELYYEAWSRMPGTLEYAAIHSGAAPKDMEAAARVLRSIRDALEKENGSDREFDCTGGGEMITLLERTASSFFFRIKNEKAEEMKKSRALMAELAGPLDVSDPGNVYYMDRQLEDMCFCVPAHEVGNGLFGPICVYVLTKKGWEPSRRDIMVGWDNCFELTREEMEEEIRMLHADGWFHEGVDVSTL